MALLFSCCHNRSKYNSNSNSEDWESEQLEQQQEVWLLQASSDRSKLAAAWLQDMAFWQIEQPQVSSSTTSTTSSSTTSNMGNSHHNNGHQNNINKNPSKSSSTQPVSAGNVIGGGSRSNGDHHPLDHRGSSTAATATAAASATTSTEVNPAKLLQRRSSGGNESTSTRNSKSQKNRTYSSGGDNNDDEFLQFQQQRVMEYYQETGQQPPPHGTVPAGGSGQPPPIWKPATDPNTGRTYYYDLISRRTQWEKPAELRAWERRKKSEKRQQDAQFFRDMERNILASLARGERVPGVVDLIKTGPPREPVLPSPTNKDNISGSGSGNHNNHGHAAAGGNNPEKRVRTISSMEDAVVLAALRHEGYSEPPLDTQHAPSQATTSTSSISILPHHPSLSKSVERAGRPPLPTAGQRRNGYQQQYQQHNRQQLMDDTNDGDSPTNLSDSMELSPDMHGHSYYESDALLAGEHLLDGPISEDVMTLNQAGGLTMALKNSIINSSPTTSGQSSNGSTPSSSNSHFRRNTGGTIHLKSTMTNPNVNATIQCVCGVYRAHIVQAWEQEQQTMHSPISVVSASSANSSKGEGGDSLSKTHAANMEIFRDDYGSDAYFNRYTMSAASATSTPPQPSMQLPALSDIIAFYQAFYEKSQMEHDTIIMSLIYVERLVKETNGQISPTYSNWRSVLFSCMVLASKVWDDLSMWNIDFSNVSAHIPGLSSFTLGRINELEVALLTSLSFNVKVPASEYAKYYFLIRTMLLRSGLLPDEGGVAAASSKKDRGYFNNMEMKTMAYQDSKFPSTKQPPATAVQQQHRQQAQQQHQRGPASLPKPETNRLRARSMDDYYYVWLQQQQQQNKGKVQPAPTSPPTSTATNTTTSSSCIPRQRPLGPVLQENICLEQLVSMNR